MADIDKRNNICHFIGAASEYLAASAFLKKGFQVYWPSNHSDAVDFVTYKDGLFSRVQVKTATWVKSGGFDYLQCRTRLTKIYKNISPSKLYDLLVVISPDGRIWSIPSGIITSSNISLDGSGPRDKNRKNWEKFLLGYAH